MAQGVFEWLDVYGLSQVSVVCVGGFMGETVVLL